MSKHSFYRPHARVQYTGEVIDPVTGEVTRPPSMTKQSFLAECDINNILAQYKVTGMVSHISAKAAQGAYLDLPEPLDFQEALGVVKAAQDSFASLPSKIRQRFDNDPQSFLEFMLDPANKPEALELGLIPKPPAPAPVPAPEPPAPPAPPNA